MSGLLDLIALSEPVTSQRSGRLLKQEEVAKLTAQGFR